MWVTTVDARLKIIKNFQHTNCIIFKNHNKYIKIHSTVHINRFKYWYKYIKIDSTVRIDRWFPMNCYPVMHFCYHYIFTAKVKKKN